MPQIKDISITKTVAADADFLILQTPAGETYNITKADLLAGLSGGGGGDVTPPPQTLWTPTAITTSLWIDSSDNASITQSTNLISQINDKSGNNRHVTQANNSQRPTLVLNESNALSVIRFNGSSFLTNDSFSPGSTPGSYILIEKNLSGGAPYSFGASSPNGSGILYQNNGGMQPSVSPTLPFNSIAPRIWVYQITNTGSNDALFMNGESRSVYGSATGSLLAPFDIGRRNVSQLYIAGDILEVIICNYVLLQSDREKLEGYAAWKWGINSSLPSSHPYKNAAPVT